MTHFLIYQTFIPTGETRPKYLLIGKCLANSGEEAIDIHCKERKPDSQKDRDDLKQYLEAHKVRPQGANLVSAKMLKKNIKKLGPWR